jgi:hypothetical protein
MNSSQLNFFSVPEDWPLFRQFFIERSTIMIKYESEKVDNLYGDDIGSENGRLPFKIGLSHKDFLDEIYTKYDEKRMKYDLDIERGAVIEFNTGGFYASNTNKLHRSRFYCVTNYYARRGELVTKSEDFKKWFTKMYRSFKKEFLVKLGNESGITFTRNSLTWMKEKNAQIDGGYISLSEKNSI